MDSKINMKKHVMWNTIGSTFYYFCQWVITIVIVYLTSDYGVIGTLGLAMTVTNTFTTISSFGMRSFQVSDVNCEFSNEDYIMSRRLTAILSYILCIIYAFYIGCSHLEILCILLYMILRLIESTEDVYQGIFQKKWRFDIIGKSNFMRGIAQVTSFVIVFSLTQKLEFSFIVMIISNLLVFVFYDVKKAKDIAKINIVKYNKRVLTLLKSCIGLVVYNFMFSSVPTTLRVSIRTLLGAEQLGLYSTVSAPTVIVQRLAAVAFSPFLPLFSKCYIDKDKKRFKHYMKIVVVCIVVSFIIVNIAGIVFGKIGLQILYNKDVASHYDLLLPLIWCTFFTACDGLFVGIVTAMRKIKHIIIGICFVFVTNYLLKNWGVSLYGLNGASILQAILELVFAIYLFVIICREVRKL